MKEILQRYSNTIIMRREKELLFLGTLLGLVLWISSLSLACTAFVLPKTQIQSNTRQLVFDQPSSLFRLKRLYPKKPQLNDNDEDDDEDEDDTPYYDGEYHLEPNDKSPFSRSKDEKSDGANKRVRPNFEAVFQGMPGLSEILSGGKKDTLTNTPPLYNRNKEEASTPKDSNTLQGQLSTSDLEEIEQNFQTFKKQMRDNLQQMRRKDPNSVPDNAEFILDQVVEEQRAYDIQEKAELRAIQAFDAYYQQQKSLHTLDTQNQQQQEQQKVETDLVVQEIVEEIHQTQEAKRQRELQFHDFKTYEKQLLEQMKKKTKASLDSTSSAPVDFDQVQLDIMRDLLIKRQDAAMEKGMVQDEDLFTTNNLEDGIEELSNLMEEKQRLGKDVMGGSKWSLKDWQMYRSIVSKRVDKKRRQSTDEDEDEEDDLEETMDENDIMDFNDLIGDDEEEEKEEEEDLDTSTVSKKMESWREYQIKEKNMRKKMGLTINRLPFPWSEKLNKGQVQDSDKDSIPATRKSYSRNEVEEASLSLDQTAVEVMTDLMMKTQDKERREKLRLEIEDLKAEIMNRRENRSDRAEAFDDSLDSEEDILIAQPVQMSDILGKGKGSNTLDNRDFRTTEEQYQAKSSTPPMKESPRSAPPSTISAPPSTIAADFSAEAEDDEDIIPTLGTLKEQKFRSLVARSGVRTVEEQEQLRRKWEDFQRAEQIMRDRTGLSGNDVASLNFPGQLKYNVSDVLLKGGDVNADAILSTLGQRPSRKNKSSSVSAAVKSETENKGASPSSTQSSDKLDFVTPESKKDSYQSFLEYEERMKAQSLRQKNDTIGSAVVNDSSKSTENQSISPIERDEVSENVPEQIYRSYGATIHRDPEKNREDQKAFEELLRREEEARKTLQDAANSSPVRSDIDIDTYADDVLSKLKPRPKPNKLNRKIESDSDVLSDTSAETPSIFEDNDNTGPSSIKDKIKTSNVSRSSSILTEQMPDWLRREIDEKRGDERKVVGKDDDRIGIFSDDYDYEERERQAAEFEKKYSKAPKEVSISDLFGRDYFGPDDVGDYDGPTDYFSSFESRKATLMEYRVLSVEDLNSLMEYKSSSIETGVSPYLAKVNRPFNAFGGIFKLEGSLIDITGLHFGPWKKTAEEYGLKVPDIDDVKFAAVHSAEFSIQRIFYWTNDIIFVRSIAKSFRRNFAEFFESWINSLDLKSVNEVPMKKGQDEMQGPSNAATTPISKAESSDGDRQLRVRSSVSLTEIDIRNVQVKVWSKVADKYGFNAPSIENVQFTSGFTPEESIKGVFMWTRDSSAVSDIAIYYRVVLKEETENLLKKNIIQPVESSEDSNTILPEKVQGRFVKDSKGTDKNSLLVKSETRQSVRPVTTITEDDVIELHLKAWTHAAEQHGHKAPSIDEVQIAKFSGPDKAVQSIFKWTSSPSSVVDVVATFRTRLKNLSMDLAAKVNTNLSPNNRQEPLKSNDDPVPYIIKDGIVDFLSALEKVNTPCAVVSYLESHQLDLLLQVSGLNRFFKADQRVSESEAYETEAQQLLGAALRVERRPGLCAVFTSTPQSCVAAHDMQMKSVALVGPYPRYDLTTSDSTLINLHSMNTMNLRALFSDEKSAEPMEQLQVEGPQVKKKSLVKTRFWQDGDR